MPLTAKGEAILASMKQEYGAEAGARVFNASKNAGTITDVGDASPLEKLPQRCTVKELNARNRTFWERNDRSFPPLGEAAVLAKVGQ